MAQNKSVKNLSLLKSERTTFQLTTEAYDMLDYLTENFGVTQKEIFSLILNDDELLQDTNKVARSEIQEFTEQKIPKTKVISKGALEKLNSIVKGQVFTRDTVLEIALRKIYDQIKTGMERHVKAKEIINKVITEMHKAQKDLNHLLNDDDPILERWALVCQIAENVSMAIDNELNKGTPIDPDDFSQNT